jgi:hypothetical protein
VSLKHISPKGGKDDGIFHGIIKDINLIINGIDEATGLE